jgi:hypothetical protein
MQAMLVSSNTLKDKQHSKVQKSFEKKPKKEPKAKKSVSIGGNVVISPYALDHAAGKAPDASSYQPPSIFLKEMEKPEPKKAVANTNAISGVLADLWK